MKKLTTALALILCVCMTMVGCDFEQMLAEVIPFADRLPFDFGAEESAERRTISYSDMEYKRPDIGAISARIEELSALVSEADSFAQVMEYDDELGELVEGYDTMYTLAMLKKYHDIDDIFFQEEFRILEEGWVDISLLISDFNEIIITGPYAEEYRQEVGEYVFADIQNSLLLNSEAVAEYKRERSELNADYNELLAGLTVEHDGIEYTIDDIYEVDSGALRMQLYEQYYNDSVDVFVEIYARIVELDKTIAYELGFGSAAEYYYLSYSRDYTPSDAMQLIENVKQYIVPMVDDIYDNSGYYVPADLEATMESMPQVLGEIDPELTEAWDYMVQYDLHDMESLSSKQSGIAFCTEISGYDAPFMYMNWDDSFSSTSTMIHEFGHFYDYWLRYDTSVVQNLDVAETYSQALELLTHEYVDEFTDAGDMAIRNNLADFGTGALVYQSLLEEFQLRVYELKTFDAVIIGRLYAELLEEYGLGWAVFADQYGADNSWFEVTHIFDAPFYTISYVTSAMAALQIWAESQQDWDMGVEIYMDMIRADQNQSFGTLLESVGLQQVHDVEVMQEVAGYYEETFLQSNK